MRPAALLAALFTFATNSPAQSHGIVTPQVRLQHLVLSDASATDLARRVLRAVIPRVLHCYEQGLVLAPDLSGHVRVRIEISTDGTVPSTSVVHAPRPLATVAMCIAHAAQTMEFPSRAAPWQIDVEWGLSVPPAPRNRGPIGGR